MASNAREVLAMIEAAKQNDVVLMNKVFTISALSPFHY
jgi:hypothetical protein